MFMCISTAQARTQNVGNGICLFRRCRVNLARRAPFLSYVHFVCQVWDIWDILKSKTSFNAV